MLGTQVLDWDSDFFGFGVAKLDIHGNIDLDEAKRSLKEFKESGVSLVYCNLDIFDRAFHQEVTRLGAQLVDEKVTYLKRSFYTPARADLGIDITEFHGLKPTEEMYQLALQSGEYSRFKTDPGTSARYSDLYRQWMLNSVSKDFAQAVYTAHYGGKVVGIVTVGEKHSRADIGIIAVSPLLRGKGVGKALVAASQFWAMEQGLHLSQVVTQKQNMQACKFYESCGYQVESIHPIYHIWLGNFAI